MPQLRLNRERTRVRADLTQSLTRGDGAADGVHRQGGHHRRAQRANLGVGGARLYFTPHTRCEPAPSLDTTPFFKRSRSSLRHRCKKQKHRITAGVSSPRSKLSIQRRMRAMVCVMSPPLINAYCSSMEAKTRHEVERMRRVCGCGWSDVPRV